MDPLQEKAETLAVLRAAEGAAEQFLAGLDESAAAPAGVGDAAATFAREPLPRAGVGSREALAELVE